MVSDQHPILQLENVSRHYDEAAGRLEVLKNTNLTIQSGEMVALVAPSGAGKSTLLHTAGLLEQPDSGEVYLSGQPCSKLGDRRRTARRRNDIGYVYQFHHLLPEFSALENVMIPQMIRGVAKGEASKKAHELLEFMRIEDRAAHRPAELSGGEQQRVAIARAVANAPLLLLADEPTGNLDPETSSYVFEVLEELVRRTGLCTLIATHNHALAARMDRVITMQGGGIIPMDISKGFSL